MRPYSQVLGRLRAIGLRPTRQRVALAKLLFEGKERHVTAESLHLEAVDAGIKVSLATVYNTLHQFTTVGLLHEIAVDSSRSYFDTNVSEHHHFYHEKLGKLEDIPGSQIQIAQLPRAPVGLKIDRVDIVIRVSDQ